LQPIKLRSKDRQAAIEQNKEEWFASLAIKAFLILDPGMEDR
jgi:hypothetical protein